MRTTALGRDRDAALIFPGWALEPAGWSDRRQRLGWSVRYTTVGGRPSGVAFPADAPHLAHMVSSVLVATRPGPYTDDPDVRFWATVCRRLLQRGTLPIVRSAGGRADRVVDTALVWGVFGQSESWKVDPSVVLDQTYEAPYFAELATSPGAAFVTPQAPFEAFVQSERSTRWVDFLIAPPGEQAIVIELDGAQHQRQRTVDRQRDALLAEHGIRVRRQTDARIDPELRRTLAADVRVDDFMSICVEMLTALRVAYGVVESVLRSLLAPADRWELTCPVGSPEVLDATLDAFAAIDRLWGTACMPAVIDLPGHRWANRFDPVSHARDVDSAVLAVDVGPTWATLPDPGREVDVVVRGVPLPVHAGWDGDLSSERRAIDPASWDSPDVEALQAISGYALGIEDFRDGQLSAVQQVLADEDACVLLPTGHGKTLIYQLAMLVRPGISLVIAPITSLIDDQEQRLLEEGIDRVAAIHAAKFPKGGKAAKFGKGDDAKAAKQALHASVAERHAFVAFVSPERLQIPSFREDLRAAASEGLVSLVVVDETHCVSEWGHDFRTSYLHLGRNTRRFCEGPDGQPPPLLALTGTASPGVLRDVLRELDIDGERQGALQRPPSFDRPNLHYEIVRGAAGSEFGLLREALLERIPSVLGIEPSEMATCQDSDTVSGIVFVPWVNGEFGVETVANAIEGFFRESGLPLPPTDVYCGRAPAGRNAKTWDDHRRRVASAFKRNRLSILVATKAFGMGIDKPNIRWTVHLGFPSSIESFAQESGRAGRDRQPAHCMIVSAQRPAESAEALLDLTVPSEIRRERFRDLSRNDRDDISRQLFFLYGSFPGTSDGQPGRDGVEHALDHAWVRGEANQVTAIWRELRGAGAREWTDVSIPLTTDRARNLEPRAVDAIRGQRMKALYRLTMVGVLNDIAIDYGAGSAKVTIGSLKRDQLCEAFCAFADRVRPGRSAEHRRIAELSPADIDPCIEYLAARAVDLTYAMIEPARLNALREMWRLTVTPFEDADEGIRRSIAAYLGDGPMAALLRGAVTQTDVDWRSVVGQLEVTPPLDKFEWAGAANRQLETGAEHPLVLVVRMIGECLLDQGSPSELHDYAVRLATSLGTYAVGAADQLLLVRSLREHLYRYGQRRIDDWTDQLWLGLLRGYVLGSRLGGGEEFDPRELRSVLRSTPLPVLAQEVLEDPESCMADRTRSLACRLWPDVAPFEHHDQEDEHHDR